MCKSIVQNFRSCSKTTNNVAEHQASATFHQPIWWFLTKEKIMEAEENEIRKLVKVNCRNICFVKPRIGLFAQQLLAFIYCLCWIEFIAIRIYQLVPINGCVKEIWSKRIKLVFTEKPIEEINPNIK